VSGATSGCPQAGQNSCAAPPVFYDRRLMTAGVSFRKSFTVAFVRLGSIGLKFFARDSAIIFFMRVSKACIQIA
jgi:hypothetical protein